MRIMSGRLAASAVPARNFTQYGFLPAGTTFKYDADSLLFGNSVKFPVQTFAGADPLKPILATDFAGSSGEIRQSDRASTTTTLFGADGSVKTTASTYGVQLDLSQRGAYKIEAVDNGIIVTGLPRKATVTMNVDSNRSDSVGPTFTSMNLIDGNGRMAMEIRDHTAASLTFSAADYAYSGAGNVFPGPSVPQNLTRVYQPVRSEATKAWYRYAGTTEWQPLTVTQVVEDAGTTDAPGPGILYRVDLTAVANLDRANVDLKFDIADVAGNSTTYTMEPAFQVIKVLPSGRRCCRR